MGPEITAAIQALLDVAVDIKKGTKSGGVVATLLADKDLLAKLEIVITSIGSIPADVKALTAGDIVPLLQILIPGVEAVIAA